MNAEELYMSQAIQKYVLKSSSKEPTLLKNLRLETQLSTNFPQMLCGPTEGQFLKLLIGISGAKNVLEIGTFTGYSTLYMASALPADSQLITCEIDEHHASIAQKYFDQSPYGHKISLKLNPAIETIKEIEHTLDFVFIDADKNGYLNYFEAVLPKLKTGGLIVIDNTLWGGRVLDPRDKETKVIAQLNYMLSQDERVEATLLPIRDGMTLCRKKG